MFTLSRTSHKNGYFFVSSTKVLGYTKQNVFLFSFYMILYLSLPSTVTLPLVSTRIISTLLEIPNFLRSTYLYLGSVLAPIYYLKQCESILCNYSFEYSTITQVSAFNLLLVIHLLTFNFFHLLT